MILIRWLSCLVFLTVAMSAAAERSAPERMLWDKRPILVHIQTRRERIIHFPDEVRYWLPDSLANKVTVVSANGVLYIHAHEAFSRTRIRVQGINDQHVYLLDITANDSDQASNELIVMLEKDIVNHAKDYTARAMDDWRIRLTRYAAQQLYAPTRLLTGDGAITRIPINTDVNVPLIRGGQIDAAPVASWQGSDFFVTALRLRNRQNYTLSLTFNGQPESVLDLSKLLRGQWLTATLQHSHLGAAGGDDDTTTLYLVSRRPFMESFGGDVQTRQRRQASDGP